MELTLDDVRHLLPPLSSEEESLCELWLAGITEYLNENYSQQKLDRLTSFVTGYVVDAIKRRLDRPNQAIVREGAGPFSVTYSEHYSKGGFFLPEEVADLNRVLGKGGTRSYRTPAPDSIRRLNRVTEWGELI